MVVFGAPGGIALLSPGSEGQQGCDAGQRQAWQVLWSMPQASGLRPQPTRPATGCCSAYRRTSPTRSPPKTIDLSHVELRNQSKSIEFRDFLIDFKGLHDLARREDAAEDQPGSQHIAEHGHHVETLAAAREAIHVGRPTWAAVGA